MNRFFSINTGIVFGLTLIFSGLTVSHYHVGIQDVFAQERDKKSESKGTHTSETIGQASDTVDEAKEYLGEVMDWVADKLKLFTDVVDSMVGIEGDNKGTNALFGLPIYFFAALVGFFVIKLTYNIVRDSLAAIFGKSNEGPRRHSGRRK